MIRRRRQLIALAACGAGAIALATAVSASAWATDDRVELATVVASWPAAYEATGMKSEPLYTEHIAVSRDDDTFRVRIEVLGQGDAALGTQDSTVRVADDGTVSWVSGCTKTPALCADDTQLRGFLATAALVGLDRQGRLPATGTARDLHGTAVVCVADADLHPDAAPATVRLDPCFDRATGAVVGHYSPGSDAFVGATLAPGFTVTGP
ncbi:hypothetical protein AB0N73_02355 [Microbacterium sp. NPDC089189]|uniref:hypothetical protein n=1 Tax=Microbacterium sp. NPDC089189 TaxID=3154972 RepID=UPI00342B2837